MQNILANGGQLMYTSTRALHANEQGKGASEWVYTNELTIHHAFRAAETKVSINETVNARKSIKHYKAEICFSVNPD